MGDHNSDENEYSLQISPRTIDKLGVKLYDKASAAVAELIANSYDADATEVVIRIPTGTKLDRSRDDGTDWTIEIKDNGHGMTPSEAKAEYLVVGRDRRIDNPNGGRSRLGRQVMGRKGIGKLAPFGICRQIELISAGGERTDKGFLVTHFEMDYDTIISTQSGDVPLRTGEFDGTFLEDSGTTVILKGFRSKIVPTREVFYRQLGRRFRNTAGFDIFVEDIRHSEGDLDLLPPFEIEINENTRIDFAGMSIQVNGGTLPIAGWIAKAKESYKNEEDPGVRIYARNKIVETTRDFGQHAGFTGEIVVRSYLVGEIYADWLDDDDGEDLIKTDRQGIIWDSEYGTALSEFGQEKVRELAKMVVAERRKDARLSFIDVSQIERRARDKYREESIIKAALDIAGSIGSVASEDEIRLGLFVDEMAEFILYMAPHKALLDAFREFARASNVEGGDKFEELESLFVKARVAELASYAQIIHERVEVIENLRAVLKEARDTRVYESRLQKMVADAPWLIQPDWTLLTANQPLKSFEKSFVEEVEERLVARFPEDVELRRPDFIMIQVGGRLSCIEIKAPKHRLNNEDFERLYCYVQTFRDFQEENIDLISSWHGCTFVVVADDVNITDEFKLATYDSLTSDETVVQYSWDQVLRKTEIAHESFLNVRDSTRKQLQAEESERTLEP
ncbi:ATP-binding protein [Candidatus Poriferisocius sp.]|uniref:ATP-binding protein n=1 Tax=Candidatus Poriferisocius sp. TaxID=3101276 RepID=UPI003B014D47